MKVERLRYVGYYSGYSVFVSEGKVVITGNILNTKGFIVHDENIAKELIKHLDEKEELTREYNIKKDDIENKIESIVKTIIGKVGGLYGYRRDYEED